jgi:hypothetical protein
MECQLRPLVYSLDLNNSPRIGLTPGKSCIKNLWRNKQGGSWCKMAGAGIQSFAKFRAQMCTAECQGLKTVSRFVAFHGKFKSGNVRSVAFRGQILPRSWHSAVSWRVVVGIPQYVWARNAKGLRRSRGLWHSAEIGERNANNNWIPVPAILHWQILSLLRHKCLPRHFPDIRPMRGELFRPKLHKNGLC